MTDRSTTSLSGTGLDIESVSVHYEDTAALDRFSLQVADGEIMAVVGPSGSGKSTLLRAVAGLEPLQQGRIVLAGRDLAGVPTHKRGLGLMFQDHGLFSHLSVADNIAYGLRTAGAPKSVQQHRVGELLDLVELAGFGGRGTGELSGGEAQRVALARALAPEPGLLMLDEPLGSLDRALREQLIGDLRRLLTSLGQTALHVTHDQAEAFALADRVAVVAEGRPVAVGTPSELWADPGSRFVAEFLGHPNIWTVDVAGSGAVSLAGQSLGHLPDGHPLRGAVGPQLVVMPATGLRAGSAGYEGGAGAQAASGSAASDEPGQARRSDGGAGLLTVLVSESVFRRGVHDVVGTVHSTVHSAMHSTVPSTVPGAIHSAVAVESGGAGDGAPISIGFTTTEPVEPGRTLTLHTDATALRPLRDRRP